VTQVRDPKREAAQQALAWVRSGMTLGLGTGATAAHFVSLLGRRIGQGELTGIRGVPTSSQTAEQARRAGVPLTSLEELIRDRQEGSIDPDQPLLDLAVDGADEVDPQLDLIKGLGKALLREKIVEIHAGRLVIVVDDSKLVPRLGTKCPLPVELLPFEAAAHVAWLARAGCRAELWLGPDGSPVVTDDGNYLARCWFAEGIAEPQSLARKLADRPGIVEHGLFLGMAHAVIVAGPAGVRILER